MALNKWLAIGRLCADPETRQTTSGVSVCRFRIAVNRPYHKDAEQKADFINCVAWRNTADFIAKYFHKGSAILVEGALRNNDYTDNNGVKHYALEIVVESVSFAESKKSAENGAGEVKQNASPQFGSVAAPPAEKRTVADLGEFEEILSDGEVPF